ncbi:MAG: sodium:proton antiporter [Planctomycetaceae bacterium]|jgi:Na+/H+ antiporter NhaD/arsenite permease-like protein|nr:sodium:proton antiporter [Planctomycetaceae bacterium]
MTDTNSSSSQNQNQNQNQNHQLNQSSQPESNNSEPAREHNHEPQPTKLLIPVAILLILILTFYGYLAYKGIPQNWTKMATESHHDESAPACGLKVPSANIIDNESESEPENESDIKSAETKQSTQSLSENSTVNGDHQSDQKSSSGVENLHRRPHALMVLPFVILLLCIAFLPLIPSAERFWESNLTKFLISATLGFITLLYYFFVCDFPIDLHFPFHSVVEPARGGFALASAVFTNAIVDEFIPFIVLLFSLFTITGGIRIGGNLVASPFVNSVIIFIGAVLASLIGTTGAAMLLIRLLIETNKERRYKVHTVVFFIFCVCNCGGCLTPLGDPPLFLGYLKGVEFTWTLRLWQEWAFVNLILIGLFFLWDTFWFYPRESKESKEEDLANATGLSFSGLWLNLPLLAGVVFAVAFLAPSKVFPFTDWYPWYFLREAVQIALCAISLIFGGRIIRRENGFNFLAIGEVAALFFGIFICMQAPLQILNVESRAIVSKAEKNLGIEQTKLFFWSTGSLSSVLDNAPTYVVFFEIAKSLSPDKEGDFNKDEWKDTDWQTKLSNGDLVRVGSNGFIDFRLLVAVSLGAVFMGAMTYIGNGPNFMVKAIAEQSGIKMPSFLGYMLYSCLILLPVMIVMTLIFL